MGSPGEGIRGGADFQSPQADEQPTDFTPRLGVLGESKPGWRTTSAFGDVTFRYRLHSNWLFAELIPALEFPREDSFKDRASLIFRVEMFFSGVIEEDRF